MKQQLVIWNTPTAATSQLYPEGARAGPGCRRSVEWQWCTQGGPRGGGKWRGKCPLQVVLRIAVAARKMRAAELEDGAHHRRPEPLREQVSRDPEVHNTPVRLRKPVANVPLPHASVVDLGGLVLRNEIGGRVLVRLQSRVGIDRRQQRGRRGRQRPDGRLQQTLQRG